MEWGGLKLNTNKLARIMHFEILSFKSINCADMYLIASLFYTNSLGLTENWFYCFTIMGINIFN